MSNIIDSIVGHVTPINKREVEEFKLLVAEEAFFSENREQLQFSNSFPPEIAAAIGGLGVGAIGVGVVFAAFAGLNGPAIMAALAGFGVAGAVGGVASIAAVVAAPIVVVAGGLFHITSQNNLGRELESLFKQSLKFEKELSNDKRENVKGLLIATKAYREKLSNEHHDLKKWL